MYPVTVIEFDELSDILKEELGTHFDMSLPKNPYSVYPDYMSGESKWCILESVGPNTTSRCEKITTKEALMKESSSSDYGTVYVDVVDALCYLYNVRRIDAGDYLILR